MRYKDVSYHNATWDEDEPLVLQDDHEEIHERRPQSSVLRRVQLFCACLLVFFVVAAVVVVARTAIRTYDIRHHQVIAKHQIASLNAKKTQAKSGACNSTVVVIRHCDKLGPNVTDEYGNQHCSLIGFQRAKFLPTLFGEGKGQRWPNPSYMYALSTERPRVKHLNFREIETLTPLAQQAHVEINSEYSVGREPYLADHVFERLASGVLCGNVTVICWKHSRMPMMSASLGCGPQEGCPARFPRNSFDQVWTIHFNYDSVVSNATTATRNLKKSKGKWTVHGRVEKEGFNAKKWMNKVEGH